VAIFFISLNFFVVAFGHFCLQLFTYFRCVRVEEFGERSLQTADAMFDCGSAFVSYAAHVNETRLLESLIGAGKKAPGGDDEPSSTEVHETPTKKPKVWPD
jgi:hypothetical protein